MKKQILSLLAFLAVFSTAFSIQAATGSITAPIVVVNSGSAPILLSGTTFSTATATLGVQPTSADTITLGTSGAYLYNFVSVLTGGTTSNNVLIGATVYATGSNLVAALIGSGTAATYEVSGTNAYATGAITNNVVTVTAITGGTAGNAIPISGSFASPYDTVSGTALTGGAVASGTTLAYTLPATTGTYLVDAFDALYVSGTLGSGTATTLQLVTPTTSATETLYLAVQPTAGDAFVLTSTNGTSTTTYTYVTALTGSSAGQAQILISGSLKGTIVNTGSAITHSGTAGTYDSPATFAVVTSATSAQGLILTGSSTGPGYNVILASYVQSSSSTAGGRNYFATPTFQGGNTGVNLTAAVNLTGTGGANSTHVVGSTAPQPLVVVSSTLAPAGMPLNVVVATGTATAPFFGKVYIKLYQAQ